MFSYFLKKKVLQNTVRVVRTNSLNLHVLPMNLFEFGSSTTYAGKYDC